MHFMGLDKFVSSSLHFTTNNTCSDDDHFFNKECIFSSLDDHNPGSIATAMSRIPAENHLLFRQAYLLRSDPSANG